MNGEYVKKDLSIMKITVKQITLTAAFLAICIVSQLFKNLSVYITGPIVNTALILTTVYCGLTCGLILSVITPITAFFITGSPIMAAVPMIIPAIMLGNAVLVVVVYFLKDRFGRKYHLTVSFPISMILGALFKGAVMGLMISYFILPHFLPEKMLPKLPALQIQFSITQFFTALIGSAYAFIIRLALHKTTIENK